MNGTELPEVILSWELRLSRFPFSCYVLAHFIVMLLAVLGNLIIVLTVFGEKFERTPNKTIMGSLAVADLLTGLFATPSSLFARVVVSRFTCEALTRQILFMPVFVFCGISVFHLITLTVDRFIAISFPLRYPLIMTPGRVKRILLSVWIIGTLMGVMPSLGSLDHPDQWVCGTSNYKAGAVTVHSLMLSALAPIFCTILLCFYARIFSVAHKHMKEVSKRRRAGMDGAVVMKLESKSRIKATVTAVLVVAAFGICWFPGAAKNIIEILLEPSERVQFTYQTVAEFFGYSNSAVNPIIYASRNKMYRDTFIRILRILCPMFVKSQKVRNTSKQSKTVNSVSV